MWKKPSYLCPSCGYNTDHKSCMRKHFQLKKHCCMIMHPITVLTDEIKAFVLDNRVYTPPAPVDIKTANQYNTQILVMVKDMDTLDKLEMTFKDTNIMNADDKILTSYSDKLDLYQADFEEIKRGHILNMGDISNILRDFCGSKRDDLSDLILIYDPSSKTVLVKQNKLSEWEAMDMEASIFFVISTLHENYLHEYERYMLRCHKSTSHPKEKQEFEEHIIKYYRFIAAFELQPYCFEKTDDDIYNNERSTHDCEELFYPKFRKIRDSITQAEKKEWFRKMKVIVKENSKLSMFKLNKAVLKIVQIEDVRKSKQNALTR